MTPLILLENEHSNVFIFLKLANAINQPYVCTRGEVSVVFTYKDNSREECLPVLVDAPLAVQRQGQDGQDHHLHRVSHPT